MLISIIPATEAVLTTTPPFPLFFVDMCSIAKYVPSITPYYVYTKCVSHKSLLVVLSFNNNSENIMKEKTTTKNFINHYSMSLHFVL